MIAAGRKLNRKTNSSPKLLIASAERINLHGNWLQLAKGVSNLNLGAASDSFLNKLSGNPTAVAGAAALYF